MEPHNYTKNEKCFLAILENQQSGLKTQQILDLADKFPDLCSGCKSGSHVITAGQNLMKKGKVKREVAKGGFLWSLV